MAEIEQIETSPAKDQAPTKDDLIARRARRQRAEIMGDGAEDWGANPDPVKMYLRRIGQVTLLTREGEVEIAKEIEAGREQVFACIVDSRAGIDMILDLPERLKSGTARAREVFEEYEPSAEDSEMPVAEEVFKRFERVKRARKSCESASKRLETALSKGDEEEIKKARRASKRALNRLSDSVSDCLLSQRFLGEIVAHFKEAKPTSSAVARMPPFWRGRRASSPRCSTSCSTHGWKTRRWI